MVCWTCFKPNIFEVTDVQCVDAVNKSEKGEGKDWVGKSMQIIMASLHDDLFMKVQHIDPSQIESLIAEIQQALKVNWTEDIQTLRSELYAATVANNNNNSQTYISALIQRRDKLTFLKAEIPDDQLVHICLRGLNSVLQPLQVYFAVPGAAPETFEKSLEIVRRFASTPVVDSQLCKLKTSGLSQSMFPAIGDEYRNETVALAKTGLSALNFQKLGVVTMGTNVSFNMQIYLVKSNFHWQKQIPMDLRALLFNAIAATTKSKLLPWPLNPRMLLRKHQEPSPLKLTLWDLYSP